MSIVFIITGLIIKNTLNFHRNTSNILLNSEIDLDEKTVKIKEKLSIYLNKFFGFQNDKIHNNESPSYWIMEIQSRIEITLPNCII